MASNERIALVTGAARGIGRAVVRRLLVEGFIVHGVDQDADALQALARLDEARAAPGRLITHIVDIADEDRVAALARTIGQDAPDNSPGLDLLVNNAGLAAPFNAPVETLALADWQRVIDVNLTGTFLMTKHLVPALRARRGAIVNLTSTRAFQSEPDSEAYAATKGGIFSLTHALAQSLGPDIRVNAIAPGWIDVRDEQPGDETPDALRDIDHDQHSVGRVGRGADIAGLVCYLAGPDAVFITGQTIVADGGMTTKMIYAH